MNYFQAIFLGIIQGLTEFLPVSSSGHLVVANRLLNVAEPSLAFDTVLHLGTLFAVFIFFGKRLFKLSFKQWIVVGVGTLPAILIGLLFKDQIARMFASPILVGLTLLGTGLINLISDKKLPQPGTHTEVTAKQGFIIGIFQAVAITPGISRSGSTLLGALSQKIDRVAAFEYSFLLSIPAILGAVVLQTKDVIEVGMNGVSWDKFGLGVLAAFLAGVASLSLFRYIIVKARLEIFAYYCFGLGSIFLISQLI